MNQIYFDKNKVLNQLLNGYIEYYSYFTETTANQMITLLNQAISENIGLVFLDEEVFSRYKQIVDVVADKLTLDNINSCSSIIRKIMIILNNDESKDLCRKEFINSQSKMRKVCFDGVNVFDFFKKAIYYDDMLTSYIVCHENCSNPKSKEFLSRTYFIESSLNYFYGTNINDEEYYQSFIDSYYELFNVNLLNKANYKKFVLPAKKQTLLRKILKMN